MSRKYLFYCAFALAGCAPSNQNPDSTAAITQDDLRYHIGYFASDKLEGRETGTKGAKAARAYVAEAFKNYGLSPAGNDDSYFHRFEAVAGAIMGTENALTITVQDSAINYDPKTDFSPLAHTENGKVEGELAFVGYGIEAADVKYDDYAGIDVKGKVVLMLRYTPAGDDPHSSFYAHAALRKKAAVARDKGAAAILFVAGPEDEPEDKLVKFKYDRTASRSGIVTMSIKRALADRILAGTGKTVADLEKELKKSQKGASFSIPQVRVSMNADVKNDRRQAANVAGLLVGENESLRDQLVIIGAHFDHLGRGGSGSLDGDGYGKIHNGADDNASGTAGLLEIAQKLSSMESLQRSYLFIAFSGEELGLLGSKAYIKDAPVSLENAAAMLNMDMIGRLKDNKLIAYGLGTTPIWHGILDSLNALPEFSFNLKKNNDGYGPSDHASFYQEKMPVLALFTGLHGEYHKPEDDADLINYEGEERILRFASGFLLALDRISEKPPFTQVESTERKSTARAFRIYLGTIPDYAETDIEGMKLSGVRKGGPAERAGLEGGDVIIKFGDRNIENIYDYTYALQDFKPGDVVEIVVKRGEEERTFKMTLEAPK